ncbi:branched-chain amino acid ABC transporter substrate-binding protein [Chelatococcus reniformis]|uniref:Branched-chain amino acid ABC transporter substrate-binding protein n=2 Tax=Chelatococcus reniformis TaxID=1494448 RepID=A0A916UG24_9HYPH|nr:ABC transporter substrate-binding protein [Chelatococcus reniformis]GGC71881.1 branched-chain amino acid ABC transporter substrate-binding protein [Chelatococcus reniformis]
MANALRRCMIICASASMIGLLTGPARAAGVYDAGASDTEIKLGQTVPYSGPASYAGVMGRVHTAYFERLNKQGGLNGRKINLVSLDDGYSPPKTVEATRRLVESEQVLATFSSVGTAPQGAVQKYMNTRGVPQLLVGSGATRFNNPQDFPWTTPGSALYATEARVLARYLINTKPAAKVAILHQVDELGRDYVTAFKAELGAKHKGMIVAEATYEVADPTADSQVVKLAASGADVFLNLTVGKFVSQSVRKAREVGWEADQYLLSGSATISLLRPAGKESATGVLALRSVRSISSPKWADDPDVKDYLSLLREYLPNVDPTDNVGFAGYSTAKLMVQILDKCKDDLTRANLLKQATDLRGMTAPINLPGVTYTTTPQDYSPLKSFALSRYENDDWIMGQEIALTD